MKWRRFLCVILPLFLIILVPNPVFADTGQPNSVNLHDPLVLRNLIGSTDALVVIPYTITYTSLPTLGIDKTFIFRVLNTDNITEIASNIAYAYPSTTKGYGSGDISFYFSDNTTFAWGTQYIVRVDENPSAFVTPVSWSFTIPPSAYSSYTTRTQNQASLYNKVINEAQALSTTWGIVLTDQIETGIALSALGETYFRNAIPGLQTMCPALFYLQVANPDYTKRTWTYGFATTLEGTFGGTFVWDFMSGMSSIMGLGVGITTAMGIISLILAVAALSISVWKFQAVQPGFLDACLVLIFASLAGWFSPVLHALIAFMCVFMGGLILFLNRA